MVEVKGSISHYLLKDREEALTMVVLTRTMGRAEIDNRVHLVEKGAEPENARRTPSAEIHTTLSMKLRGHQLRIQGHFSRHAN